jgi:hypothetical protein
MMVLKNYEFAAQQEELIEDELFFNAYFDTMVWKGTMVI